MNFDKTVKDSTLKYLIFTCHKFWINIHLNLSLSYLIYCPPLNKKTKHGQIYLIWLVAFEQWYYTKNLPTILQNTGIVNLATVWNQFTFSTQKEWPNSVKRGMAFMILIKFKCFRKKLLFYWLFHLRLFTSWINRRP